MGGVSSVKWAERNKERLKAYHVRYYRTHKEKWAGKNGDADARRRRWARRSFEINARRRAAHAANPEKVRAQAKRWRDRNRPRKRELDREWRLAHSDLYAASIIRSRMKKPELYAELDRQRAARHRHRIRALPVEPVDVDRIYARDRGICHLCHQYVPRNLASLDHLIPVVRGGPWAEWNLVTSHFECNRRRRDRRLLQHEDRTNAKAYLEALCV